MQKHFTPMNNDIQQRKKRKLDSLPSFRLEANECYQGSFPVYKQPQEITSYSIDHERRVWFDNREMVGYTSHYVAHKHPRSFNHKRRQKYYYPPTGMKKDLNIGYDKMIQRDESIPEHIDTLLDALTDANAKQPSDNQITADIITWRGIMTKIMCTPYSRNEPWELRATKHNGTIYIEEQVTEKKKNAENQASDRQKLMSYWGYRFETLCTVAKPPHEMTKHDKELQDRLTASANTNVQYCILAKTKLGNNSIIMGAEVDCCRGLSGHYGELKLLDNRTFHMQR
ncbi:hypothetical protein [Parasitella parasitica]|uniref:Decapping nuclease n=1 Tax=Parasitella parasitica TaxID=35722 RepID=A0A0B7MX02_9FUNG|nr:hypothetical protein [Parasitella parasitica]